MSPRAGETASPFARDHNPATGPGAWPHGKASPALGPALGPAQGSSGPDRVGGESGWSG
jgi:hypothetical protein